MKTVLVIGFLAATAIPCEAGSTTTDTFLAEIRPTITLLSRSSVLAQTQATTGRLRAFGEREARREASVARKIDVWRDQDERRTATNPFEASLDRLSAAGQSLTVPFAAIADGVSPVSPPLTPLPSPAALESNGDAALRTLSQMNGPAFDERYRMVQTQALRRLEHAYKLFILNGDDKTLRAIAAHDLPAVESALSALLLPS